MLRFQDTNHTVFFLLCLLQIDLGLISPWILLFNYRNPKIWPLSWLLLIDWLNGSFYSFTLSSYCSIAADSFINHIFRLHGFPDSIVSDRGTQFTSDFWNRLCELFNIKLSFSTSNHPQTDGQTERVNGILKQYLLCFINERQNNWVDLLLFAEFVYNNTLQQSINQSRFFCKTMDIIQNLV